MALRLSEGLGISARTAARHEFAGQRFCFPLRAKARAVAVLRVCGARQDLCIALRALQREPPDQTLGLRLVLVLVLGKGFLD